MLADKPHTQGTAGDVSRQDDAASRGEHPIPQASKGDRWPLADPDELDERPPSTPSDPGNYRGAAYNVWLGDTPETIAAEFATERGHEILTPAPDVGAPGETARDHVANALQIIIAAEAASESYVQWPAKVDPWIRGDELQALKRRLRLALADLDRARRP